MKIQYTHTYCYFSVNSLPVNHLKRLDKALSYLVQGAIFSTAYKSGWDGKKHLLKQVRRSGQLIGYKFPSGLWYFVKDIFPADTELTLPENREFEEWGWSVSDAGIKKSLKSFPLYDFQVEAVKRMIEHKRGVVNLPTASGKSAIAASFLSLIKHPAIVMVPTLDLLYQTRERYAMYMGLSKEEIGLIGDSEYEPREITVASVPSLRRMLNRTGNPVDKEAFRLYNATKILICDEAHMVADNTFFDTMMAFKSAPWRFGMSATPFNRSDNEDLMLIGATGPLIAKVTPENLMRWKFIATPEITVYNVDKSVIVGTRYQEVYTNGIVYNGDRNDKILEIIKKNKGTKIVVIFSRIAHGKLLSGLLKDVDIEHELVYGDISGEEREKIRKEFEDGKLNVLLASMVFKLGVDLPSIKLLIRADGGKSTISTIQILGRALRIKDGDRNVSVVDFFDSGHRYLRRHSKQRLKDYYSLGKLVKINQVDLKTGQNFLAF